jgi:hypothetical protein
MKFNEDLYWEQLRERQERGIRETDEVITICECCGEDILQSEAKENGYYQVDEVVTVHRECLEEWFSDSIKYK